MNAETVIEVVDKIIGPIVSIGEQNVDDKRFQNLKVACELVEYLLVKIANESRLTNYEDSMQRSAKFCQKQIEFWVEEHIRTSTP